MLVLILLLRWYEQLSIILLKYHDCAQCDVSLIRSIYVLENGCFKLVVNLFTCALPIVTELMSLLDRKEGSEL